MNRYFAALPVLLLSVTGLGATTGAALAGPRDDVLVASQRCAAIADDRRWLDCYYGAAQPMRGQLGLPPAPASQTQLVPPADAYVPPPAMAAAPPQAYGVGAVRPAPAAPQPFGVGAVRPPAAPVVASGPPPMPRYQGGLYSGLFGNGHPAVSDIRMTSYAFDKKGYFTVTLFDGEVWQQLVNENEPKARWNKSPSSYVVSVGQGAMGTYNLVVNDEGDSYKVKRIK
jgi:hypothetical protein